MIRFPLRCFAFCRSAPALALLPLSLLLVLGGCAGTSGPALPGGGGSGTDSAAAVAPEAPAARNPLPLDSHASAVIPRWFVPRGAPERPAFTPHWYTPRVDPLFRRPLAPRGRSRPLPAPAPHERSRPQPEAPRQAAPPPPAPAGGGRVAGVPTRNGLPRGASALKGYEAIAPQLEGVASWYGPKFHGKPTASGETYNQHGMTAAHPSLPLGTVIQVENKANGRMIWVRVNDRGPYAKGRILDLSRRAAERLGMVQQGTAPVRIAVLRWPHTTDHKLGLQAYRQYVVQVAAYPEPHKAESLLARVQGRFGDVPFRLDPRPGGRLGVVAGPFERHDAAQRIARRLQAAGYSNLVRRYRK